MDLEELILQGQKMLNWLENKTKTRTPRNIGGIPIPMDDLSEPFDENYQNWFTRSLAVIKQLIPTRYSEFELIYFPNPKRSVVAYTNFTISDWMNGERLDRPFEENHETEIRKVSNAFYNQLLILKAARSRLTTILFDISKIYHAELLDSEIEGAKELLKYGFLRPAAVICGVVLEKHFALVLSERSIKISKKHPSINDFNEALKAGEVIDVPMWRRIQLLGDLRNNACHGKEKEPTKDDIEELIAGTEKVIKTVF